MIKWITYLLFISLATSCGDNNKPSDSLAQKLRTTTNETSSVQAIKVDTLLKGLQNPWGMAFLPDGRILITEREGHILIVRNGALQRERVQGVPQVFSRGQGGLLDIALHPNYKQNGFIYISYSKPGNGGATTTVTCKTQWK